ncbi:hypothetical protein AgCh_019952 [Apium graveolens]
MPTMRTTARKRVGNGQLFRRLFGAVPQEKQKETLRAALEQIERLTQVYGGFSEQQEQIQTLRVALKQMKASIEETEILVLRSITETNELELTSALLQSSDRSRKVTKGIKHLRSVKVET